MKTPFQRVLGYNLLVMLLIAVAVCLPRNGMNERLGLSVLSAIIFVVIFCINVGLAIFSKSPEARQAHWLSLLLVLLIGFGTCAVQFS